MEQIENRMVTDDMIVDDINFDEYDRRMNALAERDDEEWEDMN